MGEINYNREKRLYRLGKWMFITGILGLIVILCFKKFIAVGIIPSSSMEPTLTEGGRVVGNKCAYRNKNPLKGDIIIFEFQDKLFIKRVIGVPGDVVQLTERDVIINGKKQEEPYIKEEMKNDVIKTYKVPKKCYFVMGDNRNNSYDSRYWENVYVEFEQIVAKAFCVK